MIILKLSLPLLSSRLKQINHFSPSLMSMQSGRGGRSLPRISERKVDHLITDSKNQVYRIEEYPMVVQQHASMYP